MSSTDLQQFLAFLEVGPEGISDRSKMNSSQRPKDIPRTIRQMCLSPILKFKLLDEALIAIAANVFEDTNLSTKKNSQSATKHLRCRSHPWCDIHSLHQSMTSKEQNRCDQTGQSCYDNLANGCPPCRSWNVSWHMHVGPDRWETSQE